MGGNNRPVILVVLDGWGETAAQEGNAIALASTPNLTNLMASYPRTSLLAAGESVGLPRGEDGNTETGHLNLGAGKIVYQDLARINMAVADGSFFENEAINRAITHAKEKDSSLHLMGLTGDGGVHSNIDHLFALINLAGKNQFKKLYLHLFTDGRDSPPTAAKGYLANIRRVIDKEGTGQIASIMGRYYAMDRDRRWERTAKAYFALTRGEGHLVKSAEEAIETSYQEGKTDEFIDPSLVTDEKGNPIGLIKENDAVIFFNFRVDRPRQLTSAFVLDNFGSDGLEWDFDPYAVKYGKKHLTVKAPESQLFKRGEKIKGLFFVTMTEYAKPLTEEGAQVAFPPEAVDMSLGQVISLEGMRQLRVAESEKERFVTYYFNGQRERPFEGEERLIVPSSKVPTYDLKPEMSSVEITDLLIKYVKENDYAFVLVNYANPDMVAHTGNIGATVKACEIVDDCLGRVANHVLAYGGTLLITGDHGNAEELINLSTGAIDTEHSVNPVPFVAVSKNLQGKPERLQSGILADVAPTVISLLGLKKPGNMTGRNLLGEFL